ncbi:MAG: transglycosylase family protein [Mycobacterium sp.]|nr:transglycosylase family protein [Mycobacterium sp.]
MTLHPAAAKGLVSACLAAILLLFAVCIAALAISASNSRADDVNWEAIAQCESSGNWAADTGNGLYGGLQISQPTWDANGGYGLPSAASPEAQIEVANRIMATQGPGAWPTCASCSTGAAPVGSLTHLLGFVEASSGGCSAVEQD